MLVAAPYSDFEVMNGNNGPPRVISEVRKRDVMFATPNVRPKLSGDLLVRCGQEKKWWPRRVTVLGGQLHVSGGQGEAAPVALRVPLRRLSLQAGQLPYSLALCKGNVVIVTLQASNERAFDLWVKTIAIELIRQTPLYDIKYLDILTLAECWKQKDKYEKDCNFNNLTPAPVNCASCDQCTSHSASSQPSISCKHTRVAIPQDLNRATQEPVRPPRHVARVATVVNLAAEDVAPVTQASRDVTRTLPATQPVTQAPQCVTRTPLHVTQAPQLATQTPQLVTQAPQLVTQAPQLVTQAPQLVTQAPQHVTQAPQHVTRAPESCDTIDDGPERRNSPSVDVEDLLKRCQNVESYVPVKQKLVLFESLCRMGRKVRSSEDVSCRADTGTKRARSLHDLSTLQTHIAVREICKYFETKGDEHEGHAGKEGNTSKESNGAREGNMSKSSGASSSRLEVSCRDVNSRRLNISDSHVEMGSVRLGPFHRVVNRVT